MTEVSAPHAAVQPAPHRPARRWRPLLAALVILAGVAMAFLAGKRAATSPQPRFQQLTFRRGAIQTAQFAPDGQTIVYGARWEGAPYELFSTRPDSFESRPLGIAHAEIQSVSSTGEMAILLRARNLGWPAVSGTLARAPLAGGTPREVLEDVQCADWSPDGKELVVARFAGGRTRLEFPIGKVLYETNGVLHYVRFSPRGDRIAFVEYSPGGPFVSMVDLAGNKKTFSAGWATAWGLAWSAAGDEIWFSVGETSLQAALYAVTLSGRQRLILRLPGTLALRGISRDGRVLLINQKWRSTVAGVAPGETRERDLSWLDQSFAADLSPDGRTLLLVAGEPGGVWGIYLRKTDGSPALRLGETMGFPAALSPDGKWVLAVRPGLHPRLTLLPVGAGEPHSLGEEKDVSFSSLGWFADGKRILLAAAEPGRQQRLFVRQVEGPASVPVTPEGVGTMGGYCVSPDGRWVAAVRADQQLWLYPVGGGEARPVPGASPGDLPARFTADGRALFLFRRDELPVKVHRLNLESGKKELWRELLPGDLAGVESYFTRVLLTPDGRSYYYSYDRLLSELYLVDGLR